jgi:hypothetical protein
MDLFFCGNKVKIRLQFIFDQRVTQPKDIVPFSSFCTIELRYQTS